MKGSLLARLVRAITCRPCSVKVAQGLLARSRGGGLWVLTLRLQTYASNVRLYKLDMACAW